MLRPGQPVFACGSLRPSSQGNLNLNLSRQVAPTGSSSLQRGQSTSFTALNAELARVSNFPVGPTASQTPTTPSTGSGNDVSGLVQDQMHDERIIQAANENQLEHRAGLDLRQGIHKGPERTRTGRRKRHRDDGDETEDGDEMVISYKEPKPFPFKQRSFHIHRGIDLYSDIHTIINDGISRQALMEAGEPYEEMQSDRDYETYSLIMAHIPQLYEEVIRLHDDPKAFCMLTRKIQESADIARNNDNSNLKRDVPLYLTGDGTSPIKTRRENQRASSKSDRGFYNDVIGRFLCPVNLDWDDESVRQDIRDGKLPITAEEFPRLLYENCVYDHDDIEAGLCRNLAHLRTVKYILTGRSSAFSDTPGGKTTRSGNGKLAGVKAITPRIIAYGACMLRFALSTEESWNVMDGEFNGEDFYWSVVHIFEDSGQFGQDLLGWWNKEVLGVSNCSNQYARKSNTHGSLQRLAQQREAKRARLALSTQSQSISAVSADTLTSSFSLT